MDNTTFPLPVTCGEVEDIIKGHESMLRLYERYAQNSEMDKDIWEDAATQARNRIAYLKSMLTVYKK